MLSVHQIKILYSHVMSLSLKFSFTKRKYGLCKKIMPKSMRKKNPMLKSMKKKKRKIAHIFKTKAKRERAMQKGVKKGLKFTHLHFLIKVYDLHLLVSSFWINKIM